MLAGLRAVQDAIQKSAAIKVLHAECRQIDELARDSSSKKQSRQHHPAPVQFVIVTVGRLHEGAALIIIRSISG